MLSIHVADKTETFSPLKNKFPNSFQIFNKKDFIQPYTTKIVWGRFNLINGSDKNVDRILFFDTALTGTVEFFFRGEKTITGSDIPIEKRPIKSRFTALNISLLPGESAVLYFSLRGNHYLNERVFLSTASKFETFVAGKNNAFRFYIGAFWALLLYNILLAIVLKEPKYYGYSFFMTAIFSTILSGEAYWDFIPFSNITSSQFHSVIVGLSVIVHLYYSKYFIDFEKHLSSGKKLKKYFYGITAACILTMIAPIQGELGVIVNNTIDGLLCVVMIFLIIAASIAMKEGATLGKLYLYSWIFMFSGYFVSYLQMFGYIPNGPIIENALIIGFTLEVVMQSLGLGYQIAVIDKASQRMTLEAEGKEKYQQLLRVISHDVKNALLVINMGAKRLGRFELQPESKKFLGKIQRASTTISEVLEQVKIEEKFTSDKENLVLHPVNFKHLFNDIIYIFEDKLLEKNILIQVECASNAEIIMADKISLKNNIFGNILSNAIKFSPVGGRILISTKRIDSDHVMIQVRDEGQGFSSDALDFLNGKTQVIVSTTGTEGEVGTGFGVKIIRSYMSIYNGSLEAYNDDGAVYELIFNTA